MYGVWAIESGIGREVATSGGERDHRRAQTHDTLPFIVTVI